MIKKMSSVRRSLGWDFLQNYCRFAIQFISSMILARLLTPSDIGIYSLCMAVIAIAHTMRDLGVGEYLVQEKKLSKERIRTAFGIALIMGILVAVMLNLISELISEFYHESGLQSVIIILSLNFLILPFCTPVHALLVRQMYFGPIFIIQLSSAVVGAATSIVLAWHGFGYMSLAWGSLSTSITMLIVSTFWRPASAWVLPGLREWHRVFSYVKFATGTNILGLINARFQEFAVGRIMGFYSLGILSRGLGLLETFNQALTTAVGRVALPAFAAHHLKTGEISQYYGKVVTITSAISMPFFVYTSLMAFPIIRVLFSSQWDEAVPIVRIGSLGFIFSSLWVFSPIVLKVIGRVKDTFIVNMVSLIIFIPTIVLLSFVSMKGVALGMVFNSIVRLNLYTYCLYKATGFSWLGLVRSVEKNMLITAISCLGPAVLLITTNLDREFPLVTLIGTAALSASCWIIAVWFIQHPIWDEILRLNNILMRIK